MTRGFPERYARRHLRCSKTLSIHHSRCNTLKLQLNGCKCLRIEAVLYGAAPQGWRNILRARALRQEDRCTQFGSVNEATV